MDYDVFNGDADGIIALHQLRLAEERDATMVTGVKRDIRLVARVGDDARRVTVLDVSFDVNRLDVERLLAAGAQVFYVDHHYSGKLPRTANLTAHIDPAPEVCTSLIVDGLLAGRYRAWAVAAAFGDNLHASARRAAATLGLDEASIHRLRELGELLNYNGYGRTVDDLHFRPDDLYRAVHRYTDPFAFLDEAEELARLRQGFHDDMQRVAAVPAEAMGPAARLFRLPAEPWSRRVAGVFSNQVARQEPELAHAVVVDNGDGTFMVSVRAPVARRHGADELCRAFPTGGGRAAAAGINQLPADQLETFEERFAHAFLP